MPAPLYRADILAIIVSWDFLWASTIACDMCYVIKGCVSVGVRKSGE